MLWSLISLVIIGLFPHLLGLALLDFGWLKSASSFPCLFRLVWFVGLLVQQNSVPTHWAGASHCHGSFCKDFPMNNKMRKVMSKGED